MSINNIGECREQAAIRRACLVIVMEGGAGLNRHRVVVTRACPGGQYEANGSGTGHYHLSLHVVFDCFCGFPGFGHTGLSL